MLGVVQTAEGLPIYREVFDGNTVETRTLLPTLPSRPKVLEALTVCAAPGGGRPPAAAQPGQSGGAEGRAPGQCQTAARVRRRSARPALQRVHRTARPLHELQCVTATREVISEQPGNGLRLVVAHDPIAAATKPEHRNERIDALIRQADQWTGTLTEQDEGVKHRGASSRTATIMDLERDHRRCQRDTRRKARPGPPQTIWGSARLLKEGDHYEKRIRGNFKVS